MKLTLTFKTPDVLETELNEFLETPCENCDDWNENCEDCILLKDRANQEIERIHNCAKKFIEYGEYLTVELDTETNTATILPV